MPKAVAKRFDSSDSNFLTSHPLKLAGRLDFVGAEPPQNQVFRRVLEHALVLSEPELENWLSEQGYGFDNTIALATEDFWVCDLQVYQNSQMSRYAPSACLSCAA
jgi:hypothetical protein